MREIDTNGKQRLHDAEAGANVFVVALRIQPELINHPTRSSRTIVTQHLVNAHRSVYARAKYAYA